jgi:hypothetical protein
MLANPSCGLRTFGAGCRLFAGSPLVVKKSDANDERTAGEKPAARPGDALRRNLS